MSDKQMRLKVQDHNTMYGMPVVRDCDGRMRLGQPVLPYFRWSVKKIIVPYLLIDLVVTVLFLAASPSAFTASLLFSMICVTAFATEFGYRRECSAIIYVHMVSSFTVLLFLIGAIPFLILNPEFSHGSDKRSFLKWFEYWGSPLNLVWALCFIGYSVLSRILLLILSFQMFLFAGVCEEMEFVLNDEEVMRKMRKPIKEEFELY